MFLCQAATDIIILLTDLPSTTTLNLQAGDTTKNALLELATILNRVTPLPSPSPLIQPSVLQQPSPAQHPRVRNGLAQLPRVLEESPLQNIPFSRVSERIAAKTNNVLHTQQST